VSGGSLSLLRNREFLALSGTAFARSQAYSTILIALALYADQFGTTSSVEGLFGTAIALAQLIIVLPLGRYVDTHNAKRVLVAGLLINILVFIGYSQVGSVTGVILMRVFQGFGASVLWITGSAVVGSVSPDGERGQWLGTYNQVGAFSSLAGDIFGGILLTVYGFQETFTVLSAITVVATVLALLFIRDNPGGKKDSAEATGRETFRNLLNRTAIRALVVFRIGLSFGKMSIIIFVPIYARTAFGMTPVLVGGILAGGKLTKALTQGIVGSYTDRVGHKHHFIIAGAFIYALGTAMVPLAAYADIVAAPLSITPAAFIPFSLPSALSGTVTLVPAFFVLFAAYSVCGIADSLRLPASMALFVEEGEHFDAVAGSLSLRSIAWKVGQVVGPAIVGVIWDVTSVSVAFLTAAGFILVATITFTAMYHTEPAPKVNQSVADD
jgi:DHA1 family multidrug resistance protein-like MFS transporter